VVSVSYADLNLDFGRKGIHLPGSKGSPVPNDCDKTSIDSEQSTDFADPHEPWLYVRRKAMKALICLLLIQSAATVAVAGEIFGTVSESGKPIAEGVKVEVTVAGNSYTGGTDKFGTYHVFVKDKGKGTLTVDYKNQKPAADVFSYDKATRYDWTLETTDGKLALKRK
jgi:hypothetical protein